ncbi:RNA-directed DNA polymerase, eukaryota, partial [Tanacetum coccineum]
DLANNDMDKGAGATPKHDNCTSIKEDAIRRNKDFLLQQPTNMAIVGGSILEVMDDLVKMNFMSFNIQGLGHKAKKGWIKELYLKHRINFVALQETKMEITDLFSIKTLWGNFTCEHAISSLVGNSGGILCVWDPNMFINDVSSFDYFLAIMGMWEGEIMVLGDLNKAQTKQERFGSMFNVHGANVFNNFIVMANLIDLPFPLGG